MNHRAGSRRLVLLAQLPIPPPGPEPVRGNVPLAAGCLKLFARRQELEDAYAIELLPPEMANALGDQGLIEAILARQPWMVGFSCYLWNVDRTLWIVDRLKQRQPGLRIVLGGPEIAEDNLRVLEHPTVDYAAIGEGEATFAELLGALRNRSAPSGPVDGLRQRGGGPVRPRRPLESLDPVASPYLEGILDAADERAMHLETVRGCAFRCKFCYYPKGFAGLHFLSMERLAAVLQHAAQRQVEEVVLLDPTFNCRKDFAEFARALASGNPGRRFRCFGELRAEGIQGQDAQRLAEANFTEVEIGLQAVDARVQRLMGRANDLAAFERGVRALLDAGIKVKVDLIVGLPGDTADSVRRSIDYVLGSGLCSSVQVFNLSILPGTAFRRNADRLGLVFQRTPPYFVLRTPTLAPDEIVGLMAEAQDAFGTEYDPCSAPVLDFPAVGRGPIGHCRIDLDRGPHRLPSAARRTQAFTLWLRSADFAARRKTAARLVCRVLDDNPHTTLQVVVEPTAAPERVTASVLQALQEACYRTNSYLDRFYSMHPRELLGAKRLVLLVPGCERARLGKEWVRQVGKFAALVWHGSGLAAGELDECEYVHAVGGGM